MVYFDRQDILRPIGLVTQPNQFGQYPSGALRKAANVTLRNPGELQQAPSINGGGPFGVANDIIHSVFCIDAGHMYQVLQSGTTWSVYDLSVHSIRRRSGRI